jgi:hypothetical protein
MRAQMDVFSPLVLDAHSATFRAAVQRLLFCLRSVAQFGQTGVQFRNRCSVITALRRERIGNLREVRVYSVSAMK